MSEPKLKYEIVPGRRPYIDDEDQAAFEEAGRRIREADERDGTNELLDAMLEEILLDDDW